LGWVELLERCGVKNPLRKIYAPANRWSTPLIGAAIVDLCGKGRKLAWESRTVVSRLFPAFLEFTPNPAHHGRLRTQITNMLCLHRMAINSRRAKSGRSFFLN
jgi:hypothetical protein